MGRRFESCSGCHLTMKVRKTNTSKFGGIPNYYELYLKWWSLAKQTGDYRVIMDIDKGKLIILVIKIGHRKKIYK